MLPNLVMNLGNLLLGSRLPSTNCPNRLISQHNVIPIGDNVFDRLKLSLDYVHSLFGIPLLQGLPKTVNYFQPCSQCVLNFLANNFIIFPMVSPPFRMSNDDPRNINILDLLRRNFPSKSSKRISRTILSSHLNIRLLLSKHQSDQM